MIVSLESVVCSCAELQVFLVTGDERKLVRRSERFQQHEDPSSHQAFSLQGKTPKEIRAILIETLGEHAPTYATSQMWVAQIQRGGFSTFNVPHPGRPKTVITPKIID